MIRVAMTTKKSNLQQIYGEAFLSVKELVYYLINSLSQIFFFLLHCVCQREYFKKCRGRHSTHLAHSMSVDVNVPSVVLSVQVVTMFVMKSEFHNFKHNAGQLTFKSKLQVI